MKQAVLMVSMIWISIAVIAQPDRWQQRVKYTMQVNVDVATNRIKGKQLLEYTNNSPDTLHRVFYHLYWNAFQPNSMMDVRSRELGKIRAGRGQDWDQRVRDRIEKLNDTSIGYQKIASIKMNGINQPFTVHETILEVKLTKPIAPRSKVTFDMDYQSQIPVQIRRAGRDASNGVRYSMSQWYPKMAEYDYNGWHPNPYVAREFYGVWGDYDVKITIDKSYILGGTGYLQNASQIGYGYETAGTKVTRPAGNSLTWHFVAPNVHDFMWAADPDYRHIVRNIPNGPTIHVLYNRDMNSITRQYQGLRDDVRARYADANAYASVLDNQWNEIADAAVAVYPFITKKFGAYPYKQYSFIHGGDGGMEYPMGTLLAGASLGTAFHEWMHTWYQMLLGTNESLYAWMDEGFTEWATDKLEAFYRDSVIRKRVANDPARIHAMDSVSRIPLADHRANYASYFSLVNSGLEEPLSTHADHFNTNAAYGAAAYSKGCVFLAQLGYITGEAVRDRIMLEYYNQWRFKHPNADDFLRIAEKVSKMELDWYKEYWVNSTKTIDYGIDSLWETGGKTKIRLRRIGRMPMPIDVVIEYKDGTREMAYIPMYLMFGAKPVEDKSIPRTVHESWKWTHPQYVFEISRRIADIRSVEIDPSLRMADVERQNNRLAVPQ